MKPLTENIVRHLRRLIEIPDLSGTKYRIVEKIASGGMGTVFLAEDMELHRTVAFKVMNDPADSPGIARRTQQEAQFIAQLEHPGIVPIHDLGTLADGRIFYIMKRVEGKRLDEIVSGGASQRDLLRLFQKICEPVAFAHSRKVVHRDLKPENIMVGSFGEVLVMDWGTAKFVGENTNELPHAVDTAPRGSQNNQSSTNDTLSGTVIGTPGYMPPEQEEGRIHDQDERSDIYALGGILFYILTGLHPSQTSTDGHITDHRLKNKGLSKRLCAICSKALQQEPNRRYPNVTELSEDINRFIDDLPVNAYHENILEKFSRWFIRNQILVWLVVAYLIMRAIVLIYFGR
jgi:eukaryotic-like serine/threonine-protein kinase